MVVRETERGLYGTADEGEYFDPILLTEEDVRRYEVVLPPLVERLRAEIGIIGRGFENDSGLVPSGTKRLDRATTLWAYLSLPNGDERDVLARSTRLQAPNARQNAVLVVPRGSGFSRGDLAVLGSAFELVVICPCKGPT